MKTDGMTVTDYGNMYIAIDPGKVTGWARWVDGEFSSGQAELYDVLDWLHATFDRGLRPKLACEDFIITGATAKKSRQTEPLDGIGAIKWFAHHYAVPLTMQAPSSAKSFATDDKLRNLGWYLATKGGHANDAARHLMLILLDQDKLDPKLLLKGE